MSRLYKRAALDHKIIILNMSNKRASSSPPNAAAEKKIRQEPSPASTFEFDDDDECAEWPIINNNMEPTATNTPMKFQDGLKRFNGYVCKFLKKPLKLKLFSSAMYITCNNSVAIFGLPRLMRTRLIKKVEEVFEASGPSETKKNPFNKSPVFLSIGQHARLFRQPLPAVSAEPFSRTELKRGTYFHERLSLDVLGVKSIKNELSGDSCHRALHDGCAPRH